MGTNKETVINVHAAKTQFSKLLTRVENGEEVIIARNGKPVAKLSPVMAEKRKPAKFGFAKGAILYMSDDFDAPDPEIQSMFEDGPIFPDETAEK